jgi:hypothetical protein
VVAGEYQERPSGLYLYPRIVSLWLHIHHEVTLRWENQSSTPQTLDWRSDIPSLLWGRVNLGAAQEYQKRVEGIMEEHHGMCKNVGYDAKRAGVQVLWGGLCAAIQGGCG